MSTSNTAELTRSHAVYRAKKRAKQSQIQEVIFDDDARREYLTGFRKRNLLKKEAKAKSAKERARLERLELRKEHRREIAERAAQNVKEVEGALGAIPETAALPGSSNAQNEAGPTDELEFEDEEQLAIVTVVEDFTPDSLVHPPPPQRPLDSDSDPGSMGPEIGSARSGKSALQRKSTTIREGKLKSKAKASKFRYEGKTGRKAERTKQMARHTEKAERAGGKNKRRAKR